MVCCEELHYPEWYSCLINWKFWHNLLFYNLLRDEKLREYHHLRVVHPIEFLHNTKFPAKSWQDPASIEGEEQNKKNCPYPGLNLQPPDHQSHALPTVLGICWEGDFWSELSWPTSHVGLCSFLESIEHDFMKALMIDTDNKIVT